MQLYTPVDIEKIQQDIPHLVETVEWVQSFLAKPHADLGRPGPVCPFVPQAQKSNSIQLAVIHTKNLALQQIEEIVLRHRDIFLDVEPREKEVGINKAFLLIFPDIEIKDIPLVIDGIQQKLKPFFVESGLMLGEFHKHNESPGLHNPNFRPLRSPIPLLAIRFMVESDLPFLLAADDLHLRIRYLEAYIQLFGQKNKDRNKLQNALQSLALAQKQLQEKNLMPLVAHV